MKPPTPDDVERKVARIVSDYTGRVVVRVETFDDPNITGTWAIRATLEGIDEYADFLVTGVVASQLTEDDLEEVEFDRWPPTSRY